MGSEMCIRDSRHRILRIGRHRKRDVRIRGKKRHLSIQKLLRQKPQIEYTPRKRTNPPDTDRPHSRSGQCKAQHDQFISCICLIRHVVDAHPRLFIYKRIIHRRAEPEIRLRYQLASRRAHTDAEYSRKRAPKLRRKACLLYTSPSPRDGLLSRMPSSA